MSINATLWKAFNEHGSRYFYPEQADIENFLLYDGPFLSLVVAFLQNLPVQTACSE